MKDLSETQIFGLLESNDDRDKLQKALNRYKETKDSMTQFENEEEKPVSKKPKKDDIVAKTLVGEGKRKARKSLTPSQQLKKKKSDAKSKSKSKSPKTELKQKKGSKKSLSPDKTMKKRVEKNSSKAK